VKRIFSRDADFIRLFGSASPSRPKRPDARRASSACADIAPGNSKCMADEKAPTGSVAIGGVLEGAPLALLRLPNWR
jgi:hypothetical protein